ncbi:hypothetical protein BDQ94DRAFT_142443 [Aspergillus welwitschiae]|uniref:Uncharacterized protein n=1 Tax=Aspergillus welwitschiae TaxID=1341132 RepID=A0A3F3Q4W6_9EURO|nr:hypothetical protein BDQ94DRAFT_142443 [Aspergillus welwitschiae]RDH34259.1 hypothetical protein BDQ94DRAFT_142443 [Aspergillus welwitschiae]
MDLTWTIEKKSCNFCYYKCPLRSLIPGSVCWEGLRHLQNKHCYSTCLNTFWIPSSPWGNLTPTNKSAK